MAEWLDEQEVKRILGLAKHVDQDVHWKSGTGYQEFLVDVVSDQEDYEMSVVGVLNEFTGHLKLNLFAGRQPVTMLHTNKAHHNPDCTTLRGPVHKHLWTDVHKEKHAYEPNNIDLTTIESIFRSFFAECNIEFRGTFSAPRRPQ
jgi:hypothetical protein